MQFLHLCRRETIPLELVIYVYIRLEIRIYYCSTLELDTFKLEHIISLVRSNHSFIFLAKQFGYKRERASIVFTIPMEFIYVRNPWWAGLKDHLALPLVVASCRTGCSE